MAGIISLVIGKPALKLKSGYFAIASMGFGEAVRLLIENMEIIGGPRGLIGIPRKFSSLTNISIVFDNRRDRRYQYPQFKIWSFFLRS